MKEGVGPRENNFGLRVESRVREGTTFSFMVQDKRRDHVNTVSENVSVDDEYSQQSEKINHQPNELEIRGARSAYEEESSQIAFFPQSQPHLLPEELSLYQAVQSTTPGKAPSKKQNLSYHSVAHFRESISRQISNLTIQGDSLRQPSSVDNSDEHSLKNSHSPPTSYQQPGGYSGTSSGLISKLAQIRFLLRDLNCACPKVLIVDDEYYNIQALKIRLRNYFSLAVIDSALSAEEALELVHGYAQRAKPGAAKPAQCRCECYWFVITDINMPHMNGYEFAEHLQKALAGVKHEVQVIGCSGDVNENTIQLSKEAGMNIMPIYFRILFHLSIFYVK